MWRLEQESKIENSGDFFKLVTKKSPPKSTIVDNYKTFFLCLNYWSKREFGSEFPLPDIKFYIVSFFVAMRNKNYVCYSNIPFFILKLCHIMILLQFLIIIISDCYYLLPNQNLSEKNCNL